MPDSTIVVAAALVDAGRLLAARRVAPAVHAGGWELPGGKVEPGESEPDAVRRECREELGCEVVPGARVPGEWPLRAGLVLHVWAATLAAGSPRPQARADHDALRWLSPGELDDLPWLEADRAAIARVRGLLHPAWPPAPGPAAGG